MERLQKVLAAAGIASRRKCEDLITEGRVRVNGKVVSELGTKVDANKDRIEVNGSLIHGEHKVYYLLHKPPQMVTTLEDPEGRASLAEVVAQIPERVFPVGRLDFHTTGALLLTNDGELSAAALHPSRHVSKTYRAKINGLVSESALEKLGNGVQLDDGYQTAKADVVVLREENGKTWIELTLTEGKNRQVHRMFEALGFRVMRLNRVAFAGLTVEGLRPGDVRELSQEEVRKLKKQLEAAPDMGRKRAVSAAARVKKPTR